MKKTITLEEETWAVITRLKLELRHENLDKTICYLLYESEKYGGEVKE